jgi:hypothetical protein
MSSTVFHISSILLDGAEAVLESRCRSAIIQVKGDIYDSVNGGPVSKCDEED